MEIANYQFLLRAEETIFLPEYKGSAFHGGFGRALHAITPTWSNFFLAPKSDSGHALPLPYVLLPPLDEKTTYETGENIFLNLTLFGKVNQHHALAQAAVEYLGNRLGLGYRHGKYSIQEITTSKPPKTEDKLPDTKQIKLQLTTRLRLKHNNRLCRQAPSFDQLIARLVGRMKSLEYAYGGETGSLLSELEPDQIHKIQCYDLTNWDEWDRFSGRQKIWMKFGGLLGDINYQGALQPFMPLLRLGEWTHIGGKTSFGLGKYRLIEETTE
ncbi:MAG: CRISPR system precrRNA processing endoribonuclease RAMP protein Cas6 [Candidatus Thiodiazotropha sp. (ex Lucinoma borealis)]|nr:CRISPR system precrRNA processing endoribonuclease RAMP protein Cas6 [Candidatus Thiodiazotropha sp. (ex Lucinoma borealis)]